MKKFLKIAALIVCAIASVLAVQYAVRNLYYRWGKSRYISSGSDDELDLWER